MGLAEKLSEWLLRRRERQEERNMRQVAAYFGSLLNKRRADAGAILQSVRDYRDCPEVTRKQAELLLEHRFFRYVYQTSYPEWRAVMDALKETRYGMREGAAIPPEREGGGGKPDAASGGAIQGAGVRVHEAQRPAAVIPRSAGGTGCSAPAAELLHEGGRPRRTEKACPERRETGRLGGHPPRAGGWLPQARRTEPGMERGDAGRQPHRHGTDRVAGGGREGQADAAAAALYEKKTGGRLPGDYLEAVKAERALLHGFARHGWDGQREVPKETVEKYGLTEDFAGIARLRWDYHLIEDNGDFSRDYPEAAIGRHNRAIRERAAKELAGLEARLFPEKAASRERKAAHLRADNRASPTASLKRERKEQPGKRQTGETGRRKPPGRRIRM